MNVLVLSWRGPNHPNAGGAEQVMHEHMKGWVRAGHKVTLFTSKVKGLPDKNVLDGIEIIRRSDQYVGVKLAAFIYYLKNKNNFNLVVDQFHGIPFFTPLYVNKPKLAVLQEVAKRVWFLNELPVPLNWLIGLFGYLFEPIIFLFYKKVPFMVGSNSAKEDLIKMGIDSSKITIVPHGVVIKYPRPYPSKEKTKTIVFLGAIAKDKGVEDAIKTFSILNKKGKYSFWVIGRGGESYVNKLLSMCKKLGLDNKVKFWGFVNDSRKFELLAKAHILINPSVHEGWGLVNIEANSVGTPVVAYDSAGLVDSVKNGISGVICKKNTSKELARIVNNIFSDREEYKRMQEGAVSWSKNFSWEESRKNSLALIDKLSISHI